MTLQTPQEYRLQADECDRQASDAVLSSARDTLLYIASRWRALADAIDSQDLSMDMKNATTK
ncbi:hypothetical protein [Acidisphaera sp. S103]|uniref:hypothetical protein n=1 Tax=Acidisphaera sp. S103 TaxID=1747223 RepID=UPI00131A84BB|nr:hypothetical protein [Acidisphaera sp. S103]